ncbi:hypothetical protein V3851_08700 [Paenibacillus sp. M1]|uniref:Butirosin biosynthesis protein H N-terminal domain-containing protein n=1 Tax=Paenibacillus haidiansis TaxID=1574488 RepID=A0ABU7VQ72_9BACL
MKILKINVPPITLMTHHAAVFSIITNNDSYIPWVISNYLQLFRDRYTTDFYIHQHTLVTCPWLECSPLTLNEMRNGNLIKILTELIDKNSYIYAVVEAYHISSYRFSYQKFSFPHPLFFYGYDNEKRIFYVADFFYEGKYSYSTASYDEIHRSINCEFDFWTKGGIILNYLPNINYSFNIENIKTSLKDYLYSNNKSKLYRPYQYFEASDSVYGLNLSIEIAKDIELLDDDKVLDIRPMAMLVEHKKVLLLLNDYLYKNNYLSHNFNSKLKPLYEQTLLIRNLLLKYSIKKDKDLIKRATNQLISLVEEERTIIEMILDNIKVLGPGQAT